MRPAAGRSKRSSSEVTRALAAAAGAHQRGHLPQRQLEVEPVQGAARRRRRSARPRACTALRERAGRRGARRVLHRVAAVEDGEEPLARTPACTANWVTRPSAFIGWYTSTSAVRNESRFSGGSARVSAAQVRAPASAAAAMISITPGTARGPSAARTTRLLVGARVRVEARELRLLAVEGLDGAQPPETLVQLAREQAELRLALARALEHRAREARRAGSSATGSTASITRPSRGAEAERHRREHHDLQRVADVRGHGDGRRGLHRLRVRGEMAEQVSGALARRAAWARAT